MCDLRMFYLFLVSEGDLCVPAEDEEGIFVVGVGGIRPAGDRFGLPPAQLHHRLVLRLQLQLCKTTSYEKKTEGEKERVWPMNRGWASRSRGRRVCPAWAGGRARRRRPRGAPPPWTRRPAAGPASHSSRPPAPRSSWAAAAGTPLLFRVKQGGEEGDLGSGGGPEELPTVLPLALGDAVAKVERRLATRVLGILWKAAEAIECDIDGHISIDEFERRVCGRG